MLHEVLRLGDVVIVVGKTVHARDERRSVAGTRLDRLDFPSHSVLLRRGVRIDGVVLRSYDLNSKVSCRRSPW
jgi:hypothetical protein